MRYSISTVETGEPYSIVLDPAVLPLRVDLLLTQCFEQCGVSREKIKYWIRHGALEKNGALCTRPSERMEAGDILFFSFGTVTSELVPEDGAIDVLYEDADVLIINKPSNLVVHPCESTPHGTLLQRLLWHYPELAVMGGERPAIVHRLDKDTTGLLLVARNEYARLKLMEAFAQRKIKKLYFAVVDGIPDICGTIEKPIGRNPSNKTKMAVLPKGKYAYTTYERLCSYTSSKGFSYSLLSVHIVTGRTHQIRVHLASIGHPLLGDKTYNTLATRDTTSHYLLHAYSIEFTHPRTQQHMHFTVAPPAEFKKSFLQYVNMAVRCVITGSACSGKTTALNFFKENNIPTWSADACVAALYKKNSPICQYIGALLGESVISPSGDIDTSMLLDAMQRDKAVQYTVEQIVHEHVLQELLLFWKNTATEPYTVVEIPLLYEAQFHKKLQDIVVVFIDTPVAQRVRRMQSKQWTQQKIDYVLANQYSDEEKAQFADYVVHNTTTKTEFTHALQRVQLYLEERVRGVQSASVEQYEECIRSAIQLSCSLHG